MVMIMPQSNPCRLPALIMSTPIGFSITDQAAAVCIGVATHTHAHAMATVGA